MITTVNYHSSLAEVPRKGLLDSPFALPLEKLGIKLIDGRKHWKLEYAGIRAPRVDQRA